MMIPSEARIFPGKNIMEYEVTIGLEVHVQLKTESKMFCGCKNEYGAPPNTHTCPVCLGMPGALPVPNRRALEMTALTGLMLNCEIAPKCKFDRKHYFYPDMPKDYQISQYDLPICAKGHVDLVKECYPKDAQKEVKEGKRVRLIRIHLEEDVAKSFHFENSSGIDFNRAGTPLMEIVTEADITTPEEAFAFLSTLRMNLLYGNVSDADMEKGQMRCDCNISLRPKGAQEYGTKIEIKNMNTISGVRRALAYEIKRQAAAYDRGEKLVQETRRWDEEAGQTYLMRTKEYAHDYRYFPDPDLMPVDSAEFLDRVKAEMPELPAQKRLRYVNDIQITDYNAAVLSADRFLAAYFEEAVQGSKSANAVANFIVNDLLRDLGNEGKSILDSPIPPAHIHGLVSLLDEGKINSQQAKELFIEMYQSGSSAVEIIAKNPDKYKQVDSGEIEAMIDAAIAANPNAVAEYKSGKTGAINFLKGQVMKQAKGKASPAVVDEMLRNKLG
ncbi:Asp-tRNA(Asn)/Glu-tRNA(Gln) amidotransferase subunit GatB [Kamptonema cortianum]|nr:Asp-tRNA(Asn)/Glu-tRNA(Gln) amidotransferase subunit GatB [Kamptonema cortianum]MDL5044494.1 Asp-tRNA(Asn)/Glu-tRNA(Gln) amidotransferase subunit GatB [Oscillatoria amoena NRMC-F 0135]